MISTKAILSTFAVLIAMILSRASAYESSQRVRLPEGEAVDLSFQYDFEPDVDIQIRIGNRQPFYKSKRIHDVGLSASQKERFSVHVEYNEPQGMILVRLSISSVSREDEGTLICDMLKNGQILEEHTRKIGVSVDFLPGKASCRQENHHVDSVREIWAVMKCSAPIGSDHGIIECYQRGERMPPSARPLQNETALTQMIWMRKSFPIYCCSSAFDKQKGVCQCDDIFWDPVSQKEIRNGNNPCPNSENVPHNPMPTESQTKSKATTPIIDSQATSSSNHSDEPGIVYVFRGEHYSDHYTMSFVILFVSLIMLFQLITIIALIILIKRMKNTIVFPKTKHEDKEEGIGKTITQNNDEDAPRRRKLFVNKSSPSFLSK